MKVKVQMTARMTDKKYHDSIGSGCSATVHMSPGEHGTALKVERQSTLTSKELFNLAPGLKVDT